MGKLGDPKGMLGNLGGPMGMLGKLGKLGDPKGMLGDLGANMLGDKGKELLDNIGNGGDMLKNGAGVAKELLGGVLGGLKSFAGDLLEDFLHGNSSIEDGIGIVLLGVMYLYGWLRGFSRSSADCDGKETCQAEVIMFVMVMSMFELWLLVFIGVLVLVMIDKLIISTLFKSNDPTAIIATLPDLSVTIGVRIAFSWILNKRVLLSFTIAWGLTFVFAALYLKWIQLRGSKISERRMAIRNVYMFNLVIVILMIVAQLWLDWWWKQP
jgi:hypothetical protein